MNRHYRLWFRDYAGVVFDSAGERLYAAYQASSLQGFVGFGQQPWFTVPTTTSPFPTLAREYLPLGAFVVDSFPVSFDQWVFEFKYNKKAQCFSRKIALVSYTYFSVLDVPVALHTGR